MMDISGMRPMTGPGAVGDGSGTDFSNANTVSSDVLTDETSLMKHLRALYNHSSEWVEQNVSDCWEESLHHFNSEHSKHSVFAREKQRANKNVHSIFRPKTRAVIKQQEATLVSALFSTRNMASVKPKSMSDLNQVAHASMAQHMLDTHLGSRNAQWLQTAVGAFQDTKKYGLCIGFVYWDRFQYEENMYEYDEHHRPIMDETGAHVHKKQWLTTKNYPRVDLIRPDDFLFDPLCDSRDPANTSSYLIYKKKMYVDDVLAMMEKTAQLSEGFKWIKMDAATIVNNSDTSSIENQSTKQQLDYAQSPNRETKTSTKQDAPAGTKTCMVHTNIFKVKGVDYVCWTLSTKKMLTKPVRLVHAFPWLMEGDRPFVVGYSTLETHNNYPQGDIQQVSPLQKETNAIVNLRLDAMAYDVTPRLQMSRQSMIDHGALSASGPGSVIVTNDPTSEIKPITSNTNLGDTFQEQTLIHEQFNDLAGGVSQQTASGNHNSTTAMLTGSIATTVQDYSIKMFVDTWLSPTLNQILRCIIMNEMDEGLLYDARNEASKTANLAMDGMPLKPDMRYMDVYCDIGMGNTDPIRKVERLMYGLEKLVNLPGVAERIKPAAVIRETMGALGFLTDSAFFRDDQEQQQYLSENPPGPTDIDVKLKDLEHRMQDSQLREQRERDKIAVDMQKKQLDVASSDKDRDANMTKEQMVLQNKKEIEILKGQFKELLALMGKNSGSN